MSSIYLPAHPPWRHQNEAEDKWGDAEIFALFMAMRTGKTKVTIDHYGKQELKGNVQNLCVLAPGGVYKTWEGEFQEHASIDLKQRALVHVWESTANATKRWQLDQFMNTTDRPRVLLMNVEAISAVPLARDVLIDFLKMGTVQTVIDEAVVIGNHKSKRTEFINEDVALQSDIRAILSGLPTPRDPLQIYSELYFLSWRILGHSSFYAFRCRYANLKKINVGGKYVPDGKGGTKTVGGRDVNIVLGFKDLDHLQEKIAPHCYRIRMEDVYDVPPPVYVKREVTLTPEQKRIYKDLKEFCTAQLTETAHVTATIVIAKMIRLHQVLCGHTVDEDGDEHEIPENRTKQLIEILSDYDGKAVIWCSYDFDVRKIAKALEKEFGEGCVSRFWGGNNATREAEEVLFKTDPKHRFMVATPAAGGRSRKWSLADLTIYYSNTDNLDHRDQSERRTDEVEKDVPNTYIDLCVSGTVDEVFIKSLREKINLAGAITGDTWREWLI